MDKQQTPAPMSIDDAMTALICGATPRERLAAAEALAAAAQREADRIRNSLAREAL